MGWPIYLELCTLHIFKKTLGSQVCKIVSVNDVLSMCKEGIGG